MTETLEHHHPRRYDRERQAARTETALVVTVVLAAALALPSCGRAATSHSLA
jgi:hypothetical protein